VWPLVNLASAAEIASPYDVVTDPKLRAECNALYFGHLQRLEDRRADLTKRIKTAPATLPKKNPKQLRSKTDLSRERADVEREIERARSGEVLAIPNLTIDNLAVGRWGVLTDTNVIRQFNANGDFLVTLERYHSRTRESLELPVIVAGISREDLTTPAPHRLHKIPFKVTGTRDISHTFSGPRTVYVLEFWPLPRWTDSKPVAPFKLGDEIPFRCVKP
jgi:hypothetical protein